MNEPKKLKNKLYEMGETIEEGMTEMKMKAKENGIDVDKIAESMKDGYQELEEEMEDSYEDMKAMFKNKMSK